MGKVSLLIHAIIATWGVSSHAGGATVVAVTHLNILVHTVIAWTQIPAVAPALVLEWHLIALKNNGGSDLKK